MWIMKTASHVLLILITLSVPVTSSAQVQWDAERYLQLLREGDRLYREAQDARDLDMSVYADRLLQSARAKLAALNMARAALTQNQVQGARGHAIQDFFNLSENVIVILMQLNQCDAAELFLYQTLESSDLLAEIGQSFEHLQERVEHCEDEVVVAPAAPSAPSWSEDHYFTLVQPGIDSLQEVLDTPEMNPDDRHARLYDSLSAFESAEHYIEEVRQQPLDADPEAQIASKTLELTDLSLRTLLLLDLCIAAQDRLDEVSAASELYPSGSAMSLDHYRSEVTECRRRVEARRRDASELAAPSQTDHLGPYVLFTASGVALLSLLLVDLSFLDEIDQFHILQDTCRAGGCNEEHARSLGSSIDGGKIVEGVLLGTSIAAGVAGVVWFIVQEVTDTSDTSPLRPSITGETSGVVFEWSF